MDFQHRPVLFHETLKALNVAPGGVYIDGTLGGGGHSEAILRELHGTGRLLGIDRDPDAIEAAGERLKGFDNFTIARGNFSDMERIARENGIERAQGVLLDVGVSSHQLDDPERGFSYHHDAPLDMRMSREGTSAYDLVNGLTEGELSDIIFRYGEERSARRIAAGIMRAREKGPVKTTGELSEIVKESVPAAARRTGGHPARRTFQALRIAVNGELEALERGIEGAFGLLAPGGRLAVISFHSLEDRIVKQRMAEFSKGCTCPPDFPVCVCGKKPRGKLLYRGGLAPSEEELSENPRARSARLRVIEKL